MSSLEVEASAKENGATVTLARVLNTSQGVTSSRAESSALSFGHIAGRDGGAG